MYICVILITGFLTNTNCHTPKNDSNVFVTYEGHSEVDNNKPIIITDHESTDKKDVETTAAQNTISEVTTETYMEETDGVVFIPNDKPVVRNEEYLHDNGKVKVKDLLTRKYDVGVLDEKKINVETESPKQDILFISGKNQEHDIRDTAEDKDKHIKKDKLGIRPDVKATVMPKLNCSYLDCNTTQDPVCGGKLEQHKWKYRLFLNECFFRKVNCGFRHHVNRYKPVPVEKCKNTGKQYSERPFVYKALPLPTAKPKTEQNYTRRSFFSRRSLNVGAGGQFCSHPCPPTCTDDYDPQCAVSGTGQRRVFLNHCKLDYNSCLYRVVWHQRPLSWCVGGKMADMRQNRGFIAWMQRVGVVDRKGRLTLH